MTKILSVLLLFFVTPTVVSAFEAKFGNDKEKISKAIQNLQLSYSTEKINAHERDFCASFLGDFKAQRGVTSIEPIIKTNDYNDPTLQIYFNKCPTLQMNKAIVFQPSVRDDANTLQEGRREPLGAVWHTTLDFKLYHVDIDNNPRNGKEYILYGSGSHCPKVSKENDRCKLYRYTEYLVIADFKDCKIRDNQPVDEPINHMTGQTTGNYNGIIKYKHKYYIYEMQHFSVEHSYNMYLYAWKPKYNHILIICTFN